MGRRSSHLLGSLHLGESAVVCLLLSGELASALACHPEYKLLSVSTVPQMPASSIAYSAFSWPALLKHLRQMLISNTKLEEGKSTPAVTGCVSLCVALRPAVSWGRYRLAGAPWRCFPALRQSRRTHLQHLSGQPAGAEGQRRVQRRDRSGDGLSCGCSSSGFVCRLHR